MRSAPADGSVKEVYTCHCGQSYSRSEYLRRHARKHEDIKPFGCGFCDKSFGRSDVLLRHKRRCHPLETAAEERTETSASVSRNGGGAVPTSLDGGRIDRSSREDGDEREEEEDEDGRDRLEEVPYGDGAQARFSARMSTNWDQAGARRDGPGSDTRPDPTMTVQGSSSTLQETFEKFVPTGINSSRSASASGPTPHSGTIGAKRHAVRSPSPTWGGDARRPAQRARFDRFDGAGALEGGSTSGPSGRPDSGNEGGVVFDDQYQTYVGGGSQRRSMVDQGREIPSGAGGGLAVEKDHLGDVYGQGQQSSPRDQPSEEAFARNRSSVGSNNEIRGSPIDIGSAYGLSSSNGPRSSSSVASGGLQPGRAGMEIDPRLHLAGLQLPHWDPTGLFKANSNGLDRSNPEMASGSVSRPHIGADVVPGGNAIADLSNFVTQARTGASPSYANYMGLRIPPIPPINAAWQDHQYNKINGLQQMTRDGESHDVRQGLNAFSNGSSASRGAMPRTNEHGIEDAATLLAMAYGMTQQMSAATTPEGQVPPNLMYPDTGTLAPYQSNTGGHMGMDLAAPNPVQQAVAAYASQAQIRLPQLDDGPVSQFSQTSYGLTANPDMGWTGVTTPAIESEMKQLGAGWSDSLAADNPLEVITPGYISSIFPFSNFGADKDHLDQDDIDGLSYLPGSFVDVDLVNPSRPLSRIHSSHWRSRFGRELSPEDRYFITQDRFAGCYTIPHWGMPSMDTLKRIARQTVGTVLQHLPVIHLPTFQLHTAAGPVSFAVCTLGSPIHAAVAKQLRKSQGDSAKVTKDSVVQNKHQARDDWMRGLGVIAPVAASDQITELEENPTEEESSFDGRKGQVAEEKSAMMYNIYLAGRGRLLTDFNFGIMQALLLFATPSLLAASLETRRTGYSYLTPCIEMAQQMGLLDMEEAHGKVYVPPSLDYSLATYGTSLDAAWKTWIKLESHRRTLYILYTFDTLRSVETGAEPAISPMDLARLPVPAPDSLWKAQSAEEWNSASQTYRSTTLDVCLQRLFQEEDDLGFGITSSIPGFEDVTVLHRSDFGAFARLIMIITLLRGLIDVGRGKRSSGTYIDVYSMWMTEEKARVVFGNAVDRGLRMAELVAMYGLALQRWRQGWDFDSLCATAAPESFFIGMRDDVDAAASQPSRGSTSSAAAASAAMSREKTNKGFPNPGFFDENSATYSPFDLTASFSGSSDSPGLLPVPSLLGSFPAGIFGGGARAWNDSSAARTNSASSSRDRVRTPSDGHGQLRLGGSGGQEEDGEEFRGNKRDQTLFYEEALPYYWISQALHNNLSNEPSIANTRRGGPHDISPGGTPRTLEDGLREIASRDWLRGVDLGGMLQSARVFTRMGEGVNAV